MRFFRTAVLSTLFPSTVVDVTVTVFVTTPLFPMTWKYLHTCRSRLITRSGGEFADYGERKRFDFFVRHLMGVNPPEWSAAPTSSK